MPNIHSQLFIHIYWFHSKVSLHTFNLPCMLHIHQDNLFPDTKLILVTESKQVQLTKIPKGTPSWITNNRLSFAKTNLIEIVLIVQNWWYRIHHWALKLLFPCFREIACIKVNAIRSNLFMLEMQPLLTAQRATLAAAPGSPRQRVQQVWLSFYPHLAAHFSSFA